MQLVLANLFFAQFLDWPFKVFLEAVDLIGIAIDGAGREVAYKHVFGHTFDEWVEPIFIRCHDAKIPLAQKRSG